MVQDADPQQLAGRYQSVSQSPVLRAWGWISAGMIVKKNDRSGRFTYGERKDLTWMHDAEREASLRNRGFFDHDIFFNSFFVQL